MDPQVFEETFVWYLIEHTGLSRREVELFLDAQDTFWESRLALYEEMLRESEET